MRKSSLFFALTLLQGVLCLVLLVHALAVRESAAHEAAHRREAAVRWGLTDLALFTEARYTRHPSLADRHSAFQEHPLALEHFPSGSLFGPPAALTR